MHDEHHIPSLKGQLRGLANELSWDPLDAEERARALVLVAAELLGAFQGPHSAREASAAWALTLPAIEERFFLGHRLERQPQP
jgi:hypothetical protein